MPIKNFSQYLIEEEREVYFTFGRMNPPTIGHGKVMDTLAAKSGKSDYKVYLSHSQNPKKDPLSYVEKVKHTRKMFPKHARQVMMDKDVKNVFDIASKLYEQGYTKVNMVVGADRIREFEVLLNKYNGVKARHGFYNFKKINIISAGERDPDATGIEGMSASKQRENASKNDFVTFAQGVPKGMSNKDARALFNDVRKGMGLKEEKEFKNHIELKTVSETREKFVQGELYSVGDLVVIKESGIITEVTRLGANYVITETNGIQTRRWLDSVELLERQDPDIKDREGTQPARYHSGLKKSTKVARDAHFKKHGKKADDDASAYKPAPGDATAKTKPSKYTKQFKDMYDEDCWDGYKQVGMKDKDGKSVPNCIPEARAKQAVAGNKVQKLVTGFGMTYKGKKYDEIDLELVGIDNSTEVVTFRILHPKEHIGDEVKIPFKTLRRGRFMATDTSKINEYGGPKISRADYLKKGREYHSVEEDITPRWMKDMIGTKLSPKKHQQALDVLTKIIDRKKKETGGRLRHGIEYYAAQVAKQYDGVDFRNLAKAYGNSVKEETDPVKTARDAIEREKESDKKKHDQILDRARLARAKLKNRETK